MTEKQDLQEKILVKMEYLIRQVFKERRDFFIAEIKNRLTPLGIANAAAPAEYVWQGVESLSQLRSIVGGRFQNLKERWVNAGLPLREHKGDRGALPKIDEENWLELSSWILKQGFETRLAQPAAGYLFEIKIKPENN